MDKLLYVFKTIKGGGLTSVIIDKLNYIAENTSFEIHILTEFPNDKISIKELSSDIIIHQLPISNLILKKRVPILGYFQLLKEVQLEYQKFIEFLQPSVITGFNYGYNKEFLPFIKTKGIKVIELHGSYSSKGLLSRKTDIIDYFRKNEELIHNKYNYGITLTEEDKNDRKYFKIPIKVIYNSIQIPEKNIEFKKRENIIIAVGTLTQNKNFIDLIESVKNIKDKIKGWKIHIFGEGNEKEYLLNKIEEYKLENIIELKGFYYNKEEIYKNAKLLISTSKSEGFPRNILEAMSYEIPVIAYDCKCGPKEIIEDGVNGFLVNFSVVELSERILTLISNPKLLTEFSVNTHLSLRKYNFTDIMTKWVDFYKEIIKNRDKIG